MVIEEGQEPTVETPAEVAETPQAPEAPPAGNSPQEQGSDGHPAWAPIREALGDVMFHKIRPHLQEFDSEAQKRITELNSRYEPWKALSEQQITPDVVKRALGIVQSIDANPLQMYEALGNHLRQQGLLQEQAPQSQVQGEPGEEDEEPEDPRDVALRELQEQQAQVQQFLEQQMAAARQAEYDRQADAALEAEINALRQARPGMSREEEGTLVQRLALYMRAGQYDMTLEKVAAEFDAERNRILSQPRPNDFAPRIAGAGGGAPTGIPQQKDPSEFTKEESQAYLVDLLTRGKQS